MMLFSFIAYFIISLPLGYLFFVFDWDSPVYGWFSRSLWPAPELCIISDSDIKQEPESDYVFYFNENCLRIYFTICLLFGAIGYIHQQMTLLTTPNGTEETISKRRKTTHQIVTQLYEAEIIDRHYVSDDLMNILNTKGRWKKKRPIDFSANSDWYIATDASGHPFIAGIKSKTWYWCSKPRSKVPQTNCTGSSW